MNTISSAPDLIVHNGKVVTVDVYFKPMLAADTVDPNVIAPLATVASGYTAWSPRMETLFPSR